MLVQVDSTTLINTDQITYVNKHTDNKISVSFTSGSSIYVHMSMPEFFRLIVRNEPLELLTEEDYTGNL